MIIYESLLGTFFASPAHWVANVRALQLDFHAHLTYVEPEAQRGLGIHLVLVVNLANRQAAVKTQALQTASSGSGCCHALLQSVI